LLEYINDEQRWLWPTCPSRTIRSVCGKPRAPLRKGQTNYLYPSDISGNAIRAIYAYVSDTDPQEKIQKGSVEEVVELGITQCRSRQRFQVRLSGRLLPVGTAPRQYSLYPAYVLQPGSYAVKRGFGRDGSADIYKEVIATAPAIRALKRIDRDTQKLELKRGELLQDAARANSPEDLMQVVPAWKY